MASPGVRPKEASEEESGENEAGAPKFQDPPPRVTSVSDVGRLNISFVRRRLTADISARVSLPEGSCHG